MRERRVSSTCGGRAEEQQLPTPPPPPPRRIFPSSAARKRGEKRWEREGGRDKEIFPLIAATIIRRWRRPLSD